MKTVKSVRWIVIVLAMQNLIIAEERSSDNAPEGWTAESPRDEIRPNFSYEPNCGPNGTGCFVMSANGQSENMGQWTRIVPVVGARHYSFQALRKATGIETPRRRTLVRITWQDDQGNLAQMGPGVHLSFKSSQRQLSKVQDNITLEEEEKFREYDREPKWLSNPNGARPGLMSILFGCANVIPVAAVINLAPVMNLDCNAVGGRADERLDDQAFLRKATGR